MKNCLPTTRPGHSSRAIEIAKLFAIGLFATLWGCGGGGSSGPSGVTPSITLTGKVTMPPGVALPTGATVVSGGASSPVAANGTFNVATFTSGVHVVSLQDKNGKLVMFGTTSLNGTATIDGQHTAAALLYFGLGLWQAPQASIQPLMSDLLSLAETTTLAQVVVARMRANPTAINDSDSQILSAEVTAETSIAPLGSGGTRGTPGVPNTTTRDPETVQLLIQPSASSPQSGAAITPDTSENNSNRFTLVNNFRRPVTYYLYHVADVDADGKSHPITPYNQVGGPIEVENPEGLSVLTTIKAMFGKPVPWIPTHGPGDVSATLTKDMTQSAYKVVTVGPTSRILSLGNPWQKKEYASFQASWKTERDDLALEAFINDFLLPLLVGLDVSPLSSLSKKQITDIKSFLKNDLPTVTALIVAGNFQGALKLSIQQLAQDGGALITKLGGILQSRAGPLVAALKLLYKAYGIIDRAMSFGDVAKSVNDLANSNVTDEWDIKVVKTQVRLTPATTTLGPSGAQKFTTTVSGGGTGFRYEWDAGKYGTFNDGKGKEGNTINTDQASATYDVGRSAPKTGTDTVNVTVYDSLGDELGVAKATITFSPYPAPGSCNVQVTSIDPAIANTYGPASFTLTHVFNVSFFNTPQGSYLRGTFSDDNGLSIAQISIDLPSSVVAGATSAIGSVHNGIGTSMGVEYYTSVNGHNNQAHFNSATNGAATIDSFDGHTVSFSASGHFLDVNFGDGTSGAKVSLSGTLTVAR